jgi:hypothetical protein
MKRLILGLVLMGLGASAGEDVRLRLEVRDPEALEVGSILQFELISSKPLELESPVPVDITVTQAGTKPFAMVAELRSQRSERFQGCDPIPGQPNPCAGHNPHTVQVVPFERLLLTGPNVRKVGTITLSAKARAKGYAIEPTSVVIKADVVSKRIPLRKVGSYVMKDRGTSRTEIGGVSVPKGHLSLKTYGGEYESAKEGSLFVFLHEHQSPAAAQTEVVSFLSRLTRFTTVGTAVHGVAWVSGKYSVRVNGKPLHAPGMKRFVGEWLKLYPSSSKKL